MFRLIAGIQTEEFRPGISVPIISMAIFGMINWTYKWYKEVRLYSIKEIAALFADMILHAVLTDEAKVKEEYKSFFKTT